MGGKGSRLEWVDLLRGAAVVGMIWTHAANTFLDEKLQAATSYHTLSFYHGLVSPMFFWIAGYMRGLSAARKGPRRSAWPTARRLLMILGIGYAMHFPGFALLEGNFSAEVLRIMFQSDVLHCLAISCLLLLAAERLGGRRSPWVVTLLGILVVGVTPWMHDAATGFLPLDAFLSRQHGSLFPLFPWVGFACAGFLVGNTVGPSWLMGLAGIVAALGLPMLPGQESVATFFVERAGWVTLFAVLTAKACEAWQARSQEALPRWLLLAGRESLLLYVVHLVMIYAAPWWHGKTLSQCIGATQPWPVVAGIFLLLLTASLLLAAANDWRKRRRAIP